MASLSISSSPSWLAPAAGREINTECHGADDDLPKASAAYELHSGIMDFQSLVPVKLVPPRASLKSSL